MLEDTVHIAGFIPDAARLLKGFDVFVLPSLKEGLPYTILEAFSAGVPVVATSVGGIPDIVEHQKNGLLVPPADPAALANAIAALSLDPEKREEFGRNTKQKSRERLPLSEMLEKTIALYSSEPV